VTNCLCDEFLIDFQRILTQYAIVQACFTLLNLIKTFALRKITWPSQSKGSLISPILTLKTTCDCLFSISVLNRKDHRLIYLHTGGKWRMRQALWINTASKQRMMMIRHMGHCHNEWPIPSYKPILKADDELQLGVSIYIYFQFSLCVH
jgi:hypothetical protein